MAPASVVAEIVMVYVSLARSVGSSVASGKVGVPAPVASVIGAPPASACAVTDQELMLWPAGGVMVA